MNKKTEAKKTTAKPASTGATNGVSDIQKFMEMKEGFQTEREGLITRLREIDEALGAMGLRGKDSYYGPRTPSGRVRNDMSLKECVLKVIDGKAMSKNEILDAVLSAGYQFSTDDPLNSLGVILYGKNPKFKNEAGKFSITKAEAAKA